MVSVKSFFCRMTNKCYTLNKMDSSAGASGKAQKLPQYIAAVSVCLGAVAAGTVLGWTSNINLTTGSLNGIVVDADALGWISSCATLGAMFMCAPIGFICDLIGRKWACLLTILPFSVGWLLIIFSNGVGMIYIGRLLTGLAGGAFCVAAPIYTSEIAQNEIRGSLGSFFQLFLVVGILISNVGGAVMEPVSLSILSACIPIAFGVIFFFQPETPIYCLKKNKREDALDSLRRLRGAEYDNESEIREMQEQLDKDAATRPSVIEVLKTRAGKKSILICFGLMFFQQLSGVNAVIFFTSQIFGSAGGAIKSDIGTIIVGVVQVIATFVSSLVVDRFGRKILLIGSDFMMMLSGLVLGAFFTLKERNIMDEAGIQSIGFIPIVSLIIFICVFSLGFGPIPWMASAEIMPPEIKSVACSAAAVLNWFLAFLVTRFFNNLTMAVGADVTFYIFSGISLLGTLFVFILVPETKGKSIQEVQDILNGVKYSPYHDGKGIPNPSFSK